MFRNGGSPCSGLLAQGAKEYSIISIPFFLFYSIKNIILALKKTSTNSQRFLIAFKLVISFLIFIIGININDKEDPTSSFRIVLFLDILLFVLILFIRRPVHAKKVNYKANNNNIDSMTGEEFEQLCAKALQNCGYTNIEFTPRTGDQGVDK